ncbi:differentially expressed in FDCP 6 homolog [Engraulis encrasicolus]|uniref:differentially expressed in FDCP 6 homolog n=1 Tax=Engraulis encrasicolus TaxID=184585 RepID=UPI002FD0A1C9
MDFKSELLKSIWYAFTSLDAEHCGKVSKSQLKVLSHNLYTVLNIPHDAVTLEAHFQDDDSGPVSNHGYMPYLNNYILAKAQEGTFNKEMFDELCWMMTSKKNYKPSVPNGLCSGKNSFKLFCLFNLLSEDRYPLVMIPQEVEYLLKKISAAMSTEWDSGRLEELLEAEPSLQEGVTVWDFLEHLDQGHLMAVDNMEAFGHGLHDVFLEMYHNVLKKGYMFKKGHHRKNWQERWFVLKPSSMEYFVEEDLKEKKGEITLEQGCVVETLSDREGRRCLFCVKTPGRTYEMSASDTKQRVDWIQATQTALRLTRAGKVSLHQELKLRRREQRSSSSSSSSSSSRGSSRHSSQTEEPNTAAATQEHSLDLQQEIDNIIQHQKEVDRQRREKEHQEREQQLELQKALEEQLEEAKKEKECMMAQLAQMEQESKEQRERIQELVVTQRNLEKSLDEQIHARLEEENLRKELERRLELEEQKIEQLQRDLERSSPEEKAPKDAGDDSDEQEKQTRPQVDLQEEVVCLPEKKTPERKQQCRLEKTKSQDNPRNMKQWNVHLSRLMKPISPGDRLERRLPAKAGCPKQGQALTSNEFITKFQGRKGREEEEEEEDAEEEESQSQPTEQSDHTASANGEEQ